MKTAFCTIVTADYIHYALTLYSSLARFSPDISFKILITDPDIRVSGLETEYPSVELFYADRLCEKGIAHALTSRYRLKNMDCFRWSMKPVFVKYLLRSGFDQVFYLDSDLYFLADFEFLLKELQDHSVLLTPHWRTSDPEVDETNFSVLQTSGLYNAGFFGSTESGVPALDWWAGACLYKCEKSPENGFFNDQAYLDILPVYFEDVKILRHKGCNVANWNQLECKRFLKNGKVTINGDTEIVFIHFTESTIKGIECGGDRLLKPFLDEYRAALGRQHLTDDAQVPRKQLREPKLTETRQRQTINTYETGFLAPDVTPDTLDIYVIRARILSALTKILPYFTGTVLDVGCGQMPYKKILMTPPSGAEKYIGLDLEDNPVHNNSPDITWLDGKIPLSDNAVDCAISTEVLEHCREPDQLLSEVFRVLLPGGVFFVTVPFLWPLHETPYDEYRYTPFALERLLNSAGFERIRLQALGGWDASLAQMLGLWLRRRRMGQRKRVILSRLLLPVYKYLLRKDTIPKSFTDQLMIPGISGICFKPTLRPEE